ncbi:MAG: insulinase family protein, partial [Ignavibacteria bacterium]|nr:insulinase family protein [Ignavibacteria bacterium]
AYTTQDKSVYYLLFPSNQLEFAIWIESCRMTDLIINNETLQIQKEVILEEKKEVIDNRPYGSLNLKLPKKLFITGGYSTEIIGLEEDILNASVDKTKRFYDNFYKPSNALLTISGDIDIEKTSDLIEKYFGQIPDKGKTIKSEFESGFVYKEEDETIYDNVNLPGLFISYRVPGENTDEFYSLDILGNMLSWGESSFLYRRLVHDKMLAAEAGIMYEPKEHAGIFTIYAILMPGIETELVKSEIDSVLHEITNGKFNESEIQKAKNLIEAREIYKLQTNLSKCESLSHYKVFYGNAEEVNRITDKYNSIDKASIVKTASKYLSVNKRVIFRYIPKNNKSGF